MIANETDCPPIAMLERLGSESLSAADFSAIESHVQGCARCQGLLEQLSAEMSDPEDALPTIPGFVLERELGRGGMGVVYQAWQPELARRVALKVVTHGPANKKRWLREARAMGQVRHPQIVRLYQVGEASGRFFLVLDLIPAGSLKDRITGPLSPRLAAASIETVARAVAQIHAAGMLHLDIKPSNILLDGPVGGPLDEAMPILADFGLARALGDENDTLTDKTGAPIVPRGTPAFMAPEQVESRSGALGPQTDVFALGCTLYALLTGLSPFQGASVVETLDLVRSRAPVPPRTLVPRISRDLETIVLRCLRKDMRARYASATELADDLRRWLDGFPIKARPMGLLERSRNWCARRPSVAALLSLLAVTITTSLMALALLWRRAESALALAVENHAVATRARTDLIDLLVGTIPEYRMLTPVRTAELMKVVGSQTKRLCDAQGLAVTEVTTIARLVNRLADIFRFSAENEASLAILQDALRLVENYDQPGLTDRSLAIEHERILLRIGYYFGSVGQLERAVESCERAVAVGRKTGDVDACLEALRGAYENCEEIADRALDEGDLALRERVLAAFLRMTESAADTFRGAPSIPLFLTFARAHALRDRSGNDGRDRREELSRAFRSIRAEDKQKTSFQHAVATWMTYEAIPDALIAKTGDPGTPEESAARILASINGRSGECGFPHELAVESANRISLRMLRITTAHRHKGRRNRAEHAAHALELLGRKLCAAEPSQPVYHLMLSAALEQHSKNAWRRGNRELVRSSLRDALDEARLALRLSPESPHIQGTISTLQNKLIGLVIGTE